MKALGADTALNLDGGLSAALYYNGEMMVGPGRDIPNALLFRKKNAK
jgi:exopolysaccharide biosynthesis protein